MKPLIAVSAQTALTNTKYYGEQRVTSLYDLYVRSITAAGALPVVLPLSDPADVPELLERFDGLLLPGGGDIDPSSYGQTPNADTLYGIRPEADLFETALVQEAARHRMPVLGICRGLQVINVAFGGTLHQDLPDHPQDLVGRAFAGHYRTKVEPGTRLHDVVDSTELVINSLHHQGIKDLGRGLRVAATATDGVIESIESIEPTWDLLAVQWHPECLRADHSAALFDWLADAATVQMLRTDLQPSPAPVVTRSVAAAS